MVTRDQLAEALGLTGNRINQLHKAGMPRIKHGTYDLATCCQWYINFRLTPSPGSQSVDEARRRLYEEQAVKTRLETAKLRRSVVPAVHYRADMCQFQIIVNAALDDLDQSLPADLAGLGEQTAIADRIRQATDAVRSKAADDLRTYAASCGE